ncbi:glutamine amidotransferase [Corynebacterium auriscanis]|uniref:glutamine amidotransferase n=1 Tax=Corynebacterium auriscanis TaxID=99807 RepID=UPI003CF71E77
MTFVLLCPRDGEDVLAAEYADFLHFTGLQPEELEQRALRTADAPLGEFAHVEGVFIGGSPFTISTPEAYGEWQEVVSRRLTDFVVDYGVRGDLPMFLACYGSSMLAHYLDGKVTADHAEEPGLSEVVLTEAGLTDPLTQDLPGVFYGMTGHKDSVEVLPTGATLLADGRSCPAQLFRFGEHVWASQFHPEMDDAAIRTRLSFYENAGYCDPDELAETYARLHGHDTSHANSLLRRFVEYCRNRSRADVGTPGSQADVGTPGSRADVDTPAQAHT